MWPVLVGQGSYVLLNRSHMLQVGDETGASTRQLTGHTDTVSPYTVTLKNPRLTPLFACVMECVVRFFIA